MDKQKTQKILAALWSSLQSSILESLKEVVVQKAIKTFLGSAGGVGFKAWLVKFIATELYDEVGEPVIKAVLVEGGYQYRKIEGKILVKKLSEADNVEEWTDVINDINS